MTGDILMKSYPQRQGWIFWLPMPMAVRASVLADSDKTGMSKNMQVRCSGREPWEFVPAFSKTILWLLLLGLGSALQPSYAEHMLDRQSASENQRIESRILVNLFLDSVDEGQLELFGQTLTRADLKPVSVSHKYLLEEDKLIVNIECDLLKPVPVPQMPELTVQSLTVVTDDYGNIIQLISRIITPTPAKK